MSSAAYQDMWREAMLELGEMISQEVPADTSVIPKEPDAAFEYFAHWYIKHLNLYRRLNECYDQMVHPQKRIEVRKALESSMCHILELRSVLVKIKSTEWFDLDVVLQDLQLTPDALDLPPPSALAEDRKREMVESEAIMVRVYTCVVVDGRVDRRKAGTLAGRGDRDPWSRCAATITTTHWRACFCVCVCVCKGKLDPKIRH